MAELLRDVVDDSLDTVQLVCVHDASLMAQIHTISQPAAVVKDFDNDKVLSPENPEAGKGSEEKEKIAQILGFSGKEE